MKEYWQSLPSEDKEYYIKLVGRLQKMRDQREMPYKEFDQLTYSQRYDLNREANLAYTNKTVLVNPLNSGDSVNSSYELTAGAVRTKDKALSSHLLSFNFQCNITAYDSDNRMVSELGENTEDLVNRSSEIENYDDKRREMYDEFVAHGNLFVREVFEKVPTFIHDNGKWKVGDKISDYVEDPYSITKWNTVCQSQLIMGKNVYLTNLRQRNIQKQTEVCVYEEMSWSQAKQIYSKWDRWEYVKMTKGKKPASDIDKIVQMDQNTNLLGICGSDDNYWNLRTPEDDVGILHVYNSVKKTYMIIINGIMMLPVGYSLYEVSPSGLIPIAKGDAEVIAGFAYSKGQPDNVIVDGRMLDMAYNAVAQKMSQSAKPTMSNNSGKLIPKGLLFSGRLVQGVRAGQFEPLLPPESRTITNSDNSFLETVRQVLNDKSIDDAFTGDPVDVKTATAFLERKKNTVMKLFSMIEGLAEFEEQRARLRIASIYSKWTVPEETTAYEEVEETVNGVKQLIKKPTKKKEYRKEFIPTKFRDSGKDGFRDIRFHSMEDTIPDGEEIAKYEDDMSEKIGKPVRLTFIESEAISRLFEWNWKIDVIQKLEEDDKLDKITYLDNKMRIANLFGVDVLNKEYTLQRYAAMDGEDPDKAYITQQEPLMGEQMQPPMNTAGSPAIRNPMESIIPQ